MDVPNYPPNDSTPEKGGSCHQKSERISSHHGVTHLQELINLNLPILVEVHLVQNLMQRIFINVNVDVLKRNGNSQ